LFIYIPKIDDILFIINQRVRDGNVGAGLEKHVAANELRLGIFFVQEFAKMVVDLDDRIIVIGLLTFPTNYNSY
jgi:hypothetical protein